MTCRMAIRGIGLVGGFGSGTEAALNALRGAAKPNDVLSIQTSTGEINYPVYQADPGPLKDFVPSGKLRRVNKYSRLAALAACLALQDAGRNIPCQCSDMAVIIASGYGASSTTFAFLDDVILEGDSFASPTLFSNSVHSAAASNVTILLEIRGPTLTVTQFEMSTVAALLNAQVWLEEKKVDSVLLGGVDQINQVLLYCYHSFWGGEIPHEIMPLQYDLQTAIPGEGAAFMVLTRDEGQIPPYGYIDMVSWEALSKYTVPEDILIVPGSDGHRTCGLQYRKLLKGIDPANIKTFSQIYGSMPCGQMFDLALASIAAKNGLIPNSFCSIKLDAKDNLGIVHHS
ncbi:MAG: beta-ketoacyl synthase chain length factor [Sedimentisphaerales bacterium]